MTTSITVTTHDWPVQMDVSDNYSHETPTSRSYRHEHASEFVPAHSERTIHITDTRSVSFRELSKDATGIDIGVPTSTAGAPDPQPAPEEPATPAELDAADGA